MRICKLKNYIYILIAVFYIMAFCEAFADESGYTDFMRVENKNTNTVSSAQAYAPNKTHVFEDIQSNYNNNINYTQDISDINYTKNQEVFSVNAYDKDVVVDAKSVNSKSDDAIYFEGEGLYANLNASKDKTITVNQDIKSISKSNTLYLKGDGDIVFNGIVDPVTMTNENKNTVHNDYLDDVIYNLNSGMVTVTQDKYLNGIENKNVLNFNGGILNIANGQTGDINLAQLNINNNSNIYLDADLVNAKMDRITADKYTAAEGAYLNVAGIKLMNDAPRNVTVINAVDPNAKTESGETVASKITSSATTTAYSPIFKYDIKYNNTNGNFTFTRGTTSVFNNINPALMVEAVAMQAGGYLSMLETYSNAFANMDFHMMQNANLRKGSKLKNKYAISDNKKLTYYREGSNSGGVYLRPYTSYDSIKMKNGPSVQNFSYGAFLGGDTELHETKRGWLLGLSPHISYIGSHQSFMGNSITQSGANLGFTGMFYKNNFFSGLTYNAAISVANYTTPYRSGDHPVFATGIASKTGYNFESRKGRFVIQPSLLLSYTFVDTFDDKTNILGMKLKTDPLNAFQISPSLKLIVNTKNDWHPYLTVDMNWNLADKSKVSLGAYNLPQLSIDPYIQYGLGIQKTIPDLLTCYLQVVARNGGLNGFAATGGLKLYLYKDNKKSPLKSDNV